MSTDPFERLSARQRDIVAQLVEGHPNKAVARNLNMAEATVKVHVKSILQKLRLQNRTQLAVLAARQQAPEPAPVPTPSSPVTAQRSLRKALDGLFMVATDAGLDYEQILEVMRDATADLETERDLVNTSSLETV